ncbi:MAG: Na(+)-translocating NADH-quinone reductase subunit C [bacterium]
MGRDWKYIVGFATVVCLVCSVVVAGSAVGLREVQETNKVLDRQKKVLIVAGLMAENAQVSADEVQRLFKENVRPRVVDLATGQYDEQTDPAGFDQQKALKDPNASHKAESPEAKAAGIQRLPNKALVYEIISGKDIEMVILPIEGKGLWSTLYGYLAVGRDGNTIRGITFYQHGETPGLGGEVDNPKWKALWPGRKAYDAQGHAAIGVIKGQAPGAAEAPHKVDGLSGATITSNGVTKLVRFWLGEGGFGKFLAGLRKGEKA